VADRGNRGGYVLAELICQVVVMKLLMGSSMKFGACCKRLAVLPNDLIC